MKGFPWCKIYYANVITKLLDLSLENNWPRAAAKIRGSTSTGGFYCRVTQAQAVSYYSIAHIVKSQHLQEKMMDESTRQVPQFVLTLRSVKCQSADGLHH